MEQVYFKDLNPVSFLKRSAFVYREKIAVVYDEKQYTYTQFLERVTKLASGLQAIGVTKGDRVAFLVPNIPPLLEAHYGVPLAGGVLVAINIRLSSREIAYILNNSGAKVLVVDSDFENVIKPILGEINTVEKIILVNDLSTSKDLEGQDYEEFIQQADGSLLEIESPELNVISINYTSGTTGRPKGAMYTFRGSYLNALGEALETGMNSHSRYLWTLPMFHCNGWCYTWAVTAVGGTHVCLRKVEPKKCFDLIERQNISHLCAAPTVLISLANYAMENNIILKKSLKVITAGAPPAPIVIKNMEQIGADITQVYGLTETYGPHSICEWQEQWDGLDVGEKAKIKALQGVPFITSLEMRVIDGQMNDVPADGKTLGEIVARGNNVMKGYYNDHKATEQAFEGGWYHTGDVAVMHQNGYVEIKDRSKDVVISGGENISTVEVENVIYEHPKVLEVAVVSKPDPKWGEVPKAYVTLRPGTECTEQEIIEFCKENMARYKCPKEIEFGELPKTATGKIQKYVLREKEWEGYEKRIN